MSDLKLVSPAPAPEIDPTWDIRVEPHPLAEPLEDAHLRLRRARGLVENVLWNLRENPDDPALRDVAAWKRVFKHLRSVIG